MERQTIGVACNLEENRNVAACCPNCFVWLFLFLNKRFETVQD